MQTANKFRAWEALIIILHTLLTAWLLSNLKGVEYKLSKNPNPVHHFYKGWQHELILRATYQQKLNANDRWKESCNVTSGNSSKVVEAQHGDVDDLCISKIALTSTIPNTWRCQGTCTFIKAASSIQSQARTSSRATNHSVSKLAQCKWNGNNEMLQGMITLQLYIIPISQSLSNQCFINETLHFTDCRPREQSEHRITARNEQDVTPEPTKPKYELVKYNGTYSDEGPTDVHTNLTAQAAEYPGRSRKEIHEDHEQRMRLNQQSLLTYKRDQTARLNNFKPTTWQPLHPAKLKMRAEALSARRAKEIQKWATSEFGKTGVTAITKFPHTPFDDYPNETASLGSTSDGGTDNTSSPTRKQQKTYNPFAQEPKPKQKSRKERGFPNPFTDATRNTTREGSNTFSQQNDVTNHEKAGTERSLSGGYTTGMSLSGDTPKHGQHGTSLSGDNYIGAPSINDSSNLAPLSSDTKRTPINPKSLSDDAVREMSLSGGTKQLKGIKKINAKGSLSGDSRNGTLPSSNTYNQMLPSSDVEEKPSPSSDTQNPRSKVVASAKGASLSGDGNQEELLSSNTINRASLSGGADSKSSPSSENPNQKNGPDTSGMRASLSGDGNGEALPSGNNPNGEVPKSLTNAEAYEQRGMHLHAQQERMLGKYKTNNMSPGRVGSTKPTISLEVLLDAIKQLDPTQREATWRQLHAIETAGMPNAPLPQPQHPGDGRTDQPRPSFGGGGGQRPHNPRDDRTDQPRPSFGGGNG